MQLRQIIISMLTFILLATPLQADLFSDLPVGSEATFEGIDVRVTSIDQGQDAAVVEVISNGTSLGKIRLTEAESLQLIEDIAIRFVEVQRDPTPALTFEVYFRPSVMIEELEAPVGLFKDKQARLKLTVTNDGRVANTYTVATAYSGLVYNDEPERTFFLEPGETDTHYLRFTPQAFFDSSRATIYIDVSDLNIATQSVNLPSVQQPNYAAYCLLTQKVATAWRSSTLPLHCVNTLLNPQSLQVTLIAGEEQVSQYITLSANADLTIPFAMIIPSDVSTVQVLVENNLGDVIYSAQETITLLDSEDITSNSEVLAIDQNDQIAESQAQADTSDDLATNEDAPQVVSASSGLVGALPLIFIAGVLILIVAILAAILAWRGLQGQQDAEQKSTRKTKSKRN